MRKLNNNGEINGLLLGLIGFALLFVIASVLAVLQYTKYKDARDNVDDKVAVEVDKAKEAQKIVLDKDYDEREKNPLTSYESAASYGSIKVTYPKTWSAYIEESIDSSVPINGFLHPKFVPAQQKKIKYALRFQLLGDQYANHVKSYADRIQRGDLKASPVTIGGVTGTRYDGKLEETTTGSLVALPLRDKTLRIWTESQDYAKDFNDIVLKNLTFVP